MSPLLLFTLLQTLSLSQGFNFTNDLPLKNEKTPADHSAIDLSMLSLSKGCSGVLRAHRTHITVDVTLSHLGAQEQKALANQICKNLGCGQEHSVSAIVVSGVCLAKCILKESKLHNCTTAAEDDCKNATEVICDKQLIRLAGGRDHCVGRVELYSGQWGTVCDDEFDSRSGHVVCAQLGCGRMRKLGYFGAGTGPIHISRMKCNGTERNLWQCSVNHLTPGDNCGHKEDIGVVCTESTEPTPTPSNTTYLTLLTWTTESSTVAALLPSSGFSPAVIGCIILSIALLLFILSNVAVCVHFKRKARELYLHQSDSPADIEHQTNELTGIYNTSITTAPEASQYESLISRQSSNYGHGFDRTSNQSTHSSSSDSNYEPPPVSNVDGSSKTQQTLPVDKNDQSSTPPGKCYQSINMDTVFKLEEDEIPSNLCKSLLTPLAFEDADVPATPTQAVDMNDSSSTSSGEFYENKTDMDNIIKTHEEASLEKNVPLTNVPCNNHQQAENISDIDSTSSSEVYQNTELDNDLQSEDEESPSLPEQSLQTPHNAQMAGNTVVYSGIRPQVDGNDSDSTSSGQTYQNFDFDEDFLQSGEESPSPPETSLQMPLDHHSTQMTGSAVGYQDHHIPRKPSQESDNTSTSSENSYVNVPPRNERNEGCSPAREQDAQSSSDNDYDEPENW